ncbi:MAG: hypothetical protein K8R23_12280 [Chthoniobacter sp.]|nr:hypothetical protein [Chthoniobacter sp.]
MKLKSILTGAMALACVASAHADVTVYVTGATAFRAGAIDAIRSKFNTGASYKFSHDQTAGGTNYLGATRIIFQGTFPGVAGTTTVACTFTGSVEGVKALAAPGVANNATYLTTAALPAGAPTAGGTEQGATTSPVAAQPATLAFSDVRQSSTPVASPVLQPANAKVGVVVFTPIVNESLITGNLSNVTSQQFKALFKNGAMPLSLFTGDAADTASVYAFGRNDGSGTRTTYMAESGLGITTTVSQFVTTASTGTTITKIQKVTAGGLTTPPTTANASTLWGNDIDGNGGYNSGSLLRTDLGKTTTSVEVIDADGSTLDGPGVEILAISFLSTPDANTARTNGAKVLGWNGVALTSLQSGATMDATTKAKVTNGAYSAWSFEQLYHNGLTADQTTVYNGIKTGIPTRLVASGYLEGIPLTEMLVSRPDDGAPIAP